MIIRRAACNDASPIATVHVNAWRWTYEGLLDSAYLWQLSVTRREEMWRELLENEEATSQFIFIAEAGGQVIGFVAGGPDRGDASVGESYAIYIDQGQLNKGVGRALHDRAIEQLRHYGFLKARLWVLASNDRARGFYEKCGWIATGEDKLEAIDGHRRRELRYAKAL